MRIVLFRHGIAINRDDPACPREEDRALTGEGTRRTTLAARGLARMGIAPGRVLSSPWLRASQTAQIALDALDLEHAQLEYTEALLPWAEPREVCALLQGDQAQEVLLAGHAPHLDALLAYLLIVESTRLNRLKKAGAAALQIDRLEAGRGQLQWMMSPKALRQLASA